MSSSARPLIAFLLIASFGILFAGCGRSVQGPGEGSASSDITFTEEDAARFQQLAKDQQAVTTLTESGTVVPTASGTIASVPAPNLAAGSGAVAPSDAGGTIDLSMVKTYDALRQVSGSSEGNQYVVTNTFMNLRAEPRVTAASAGRLGNGDTVKVLEFVNASWAKVQLPGGGAAYASTQYLGKLISQQKLAEEKKVYDGLYYVNFGFVNVRKEANQKSDKLGTIPGQSFVRPLSIDKNWARISFEGKQGYISTGYIKPFVPIFIVRQDSFTLPILHYHLGQTGTLEVLGQHLARLKQEGVSFITLRDFRDLLVSQQQRRDAHLPSNAVVIAVSDVTSANAKQVSDLLTGNGVRATLFLQTKDVGLSGITEKLLLTLVANGLDVQSAGHTGDDLRSLTNSQITLEVQQSRKILESLTHRDVFSLAYPQGGVNERVSQLAAASGYLFGVTNAPDKTATRDQFLRLPSYAITSTMTADDVVRILKP